MRSHHAWVGIILFIAASLQALSVFLMVRGHEHYLMKVVNRRVAMVFYSIFAVTLYIVAIKMFLRTK